MWAWSTVHFLVDTGSRVSILATQVWNNWGRPEEGLGAGYARMLGLMVCLGTWAIDWDFILAEIGEDEGILGNDFAVAHWLTIRPHEGVLVERVFEAGGLDHGDRRD